MSAIDFHYGQYAIDVKNPRTPDGVTEEIYAPGIESLSSTIEYLLKEIEADMQKKYPSYDISIHWTGRSGGWFEIHGNWELEQVWRGNKDYELRENPQRKRIIESYILPNFQKMVDGLMTMYYDFWKSEVEQTEK